VRGVNAPRRGGLALTLQLDGERRVVIGLEDSTAPLYGANADPMPNAIVAPGPLVRLQLLHLSDAFCVNFPAASQTPVHYLRALAALFATIEAQAVHSLLLMLQQPPTQASAPLTLQTATWPVAGSRTSRCQVVMARMPSHDGASYVHVLHTACSRPVAMAHHHHHQAAALATRALVPLTEALHGGDVEGAAAAVVQQVLLPAQAEPIAIAAAGALDAGGGRAAPGSQHATLTPNIPSTGQQMPANLSQVHLMAAAVQRVNTLFSPGTSFTTSNTPLPAVSAVAVDDALGPNATALPDPGIMQTGPMLTAGFVHGNGVGSKSTDGEAVGASLQQKLAATARRRRTATRFEVMLNESPSLVTLISLQVSEQGRFGMRPKWAWSRAEAAWLQAEISVPVGERAQCKERKRFW
jgi:hypothetical protein